MFQKDSDAFACSSKRKKSLLNQISYMGAKVLLKLTWLILIFSDDFIIWSKVFDSSPDDATLYLIILMESLSSSPDKVYGPREFPMGPTIQQIL